jgi:carbon-monoxide dehydrogenase large subunit
VLGGSAATIAADKVVAKAKKIAAHALEAAEDDIEFADGSFRVVGTDRAIGLKDVVQAAYVPSRLPKGIETAPSPFWAPLGCVALQEQRQSV